MQVLRPNQREEWMDVLRRCRHDLYHLPFYHAQAERRGEGEAQFFVHREGDHVIALPLLFRSLRFLPGLGPVSDDWQDVTSIYGYAGPLASHVVLPDAVVRRFQEALTQQLRAAGTVTVFSRLHPLLPQTHLLAGLGVCQHTKQTVAIDLALPSEVLRAHYRKNHKEGINWLRRMGVTCRRDPELTRLDDFVPLYHETMKRVRAAAYYFFPRSYFAELFEEGSPQVHLFVCEQEGRVLCGGVFFECDGIIQYHLGGTWNAYLEHAPMKLLIETVRLWGQERGARFLHLGGGVTANPTDSLLRFKTGFSDRTYEFRTWCWVVNPGAHALLVEWKRRWDAEHGQQPAFRDFFPEYRTPTVAVQEQWA